MKSKNDIKKTVGILTGAVATTMVLGNVALIIPSAMETNKQNIAEESAEDNIDLKKELKDDNTSVSYKNENSIFQGVEDTTIEVGEEFLVEDGVYAIDTYGNDLTDKINIEGQVDINKEGLYKVIYSVVDNLGIQSQVVRNVEVIKIEHKAPLIIGADDLIIDVGDVFESRKNVIALDEKGNTITDNITIEGEVNTKIPGFYTVLYKVADNNGLETLFSRRIVVLGSSFN